MDKLTQYSRNWLNTLPNGLLRTAINLWLPFWGAGIKVTNIAKDYCHIEVRLKMHWYNKNYVGTHFGGSIYAMTDPFFMLMLIKNLGNHYIVWDKAGYIEFKKPGRGTLHATFQFSQEEIQVIRDQASRQDKYIFDRTVDVLDQKGEVVASVVKTLYVRLKKKTL